MPLTKASAAAALLAALTACTTVADLAGEPGPDAQAAGSCGAEERQNLVGTSVGTLDPATLPDPNRVIFPGQAVTLDLRDDRLNVEIGPDDRVARVFCG